MKKILYILLFVPLLIFGQSSMNVMSEYIDCIEGNTIEISNLQSEITETENSLLVTQTQYYETLDYCNIHFIEENRTYCYNEVELFFNTVLVELLMNIETLQMELYSLQLSNPCGDSPDDLCMYIYCEDSYDLTTMIWNSESTEAECIDQNHILGTQYYCCAMYFCGVPGCTDVTACNYDVTAEVNNYSCLYSIQDCVSQGVNNWYSETELEIGWNMIGYGCPEPINVELVLSNFVNEIVLLKDNNGSTYIPEYGFNGIGEFISGLGYQIKLSQNIENFSLCNWYSSDIPLDNITNMIESNLNLDLTNSNLNDSLTSLLNYQNELLNSLELTNLKNSILLDVIGETNLLIDSFSIQNSLIGCVDSLACNYDISHQYDDGSCEYVEFGYDCEGDFTEYVVGMEAEGGIVFYVDETGEHGLVAAMEDLDSYEWGCYGTSISGSDGVGIGTGYQNTFDIVAGCSETPIAASFALAYESEGYSDWYLPSNYELVEMYNTVGNGGPEGNIGGFSNNWYWSSSETSSNTAWDVYFSDGSNTVGNGGTKDETRSVRIIRAF